jgi:hypothetical protein
MLVNALKWKRQRLAGWGLLNKSRTVQNAEDLKTEAETGKVYHPGLDKWGRPILVFDNHVENTWKQDQNIAVADMHGAYRPRFGASAGHHDPCH